MIELAKKTSTVISSKKTLIRGKNNWIKIKYIIFKKI